MKWWIRNSFEGMYLIGATSYKYKGHKNAAFVPIKENIIDLDKLDNYKQQVIKIVKENSK